MSGYIISNGVRYMTMPKYAWVQQADAVVSQANPVSGTTYPVLAANDDVRIISIYSAVTWTVQPNLETFLTIDGINIIFPANAPATATAYYAILISANTPATQSYTLTDPAYIRPFLIEGQNISIGIETTGGTASLLACRVKWAKLLPT